VLPLAAFRPDRNETSVVCTRASSEERFQLPLQGYGIMRTTRVDMESQRSISDGLPEPVLNSSRTALKGAMGTLI